MTSDVDVNVLAQCFELSAYDNLLKPPYWQKVWQQMQIEIFGDAADTSVYPRGDYLQAALKNLELDIFISNLIASQTSSIEADEPEGVTAMTLMNALQTQEFGQRFEGKIDVAESIMKALWHCQWWQPMHEGDTFVKFEEVVQLCDRIKKFGIAERRNFAWGILQRWDKVLDCFWAAREEHDQEEAEKREQA